MPRATKFGVGHKEVIPTICTREPICAAVHVAKARPIILVETIFDGNNRVLLAPGLPQGVHLLSAFFALARFLQVVCPSSKKELAAGSRAMQTSFPA